MFEFIGGVVELVMGMLGLVGTGGFSRSLVSNGFLGDLGENVGFGECRFLVWVLVVVSDGELIAGLYPIGIVGNM